MATLSRNLKLNPKWTTSHGENEHKQHIRSRLTKILCTIGPKSADPEMLEKLIDGGMSAAWLNLTHGSHSNHSTIIENLSAIMKKKKIDSQFPIVVELQGPRIRTGKVKDGSVNLVAGSEVRVTSNTSLVGDEHLIVIGFPNLHNVVRDRILIADGNIQLLAKSIDFAKQEIVCTVSNSATLGENKSVHLPGAVFNLPTVSEKDRQDIMFALSKGVTVLCAPIRSPSNIYQIKDVMRDAGKDVRILAKIESTEGIDNFDLILRNSDGIVISRGDLGVELPMELVFKAQKMMISKCTAASKPVIVSTQMLESMMVNPRPTRAEATDVANAVLDGAECVMLSGETSIGDYPLEALHYMNDMCLEAEAVEAVGDYPSLFEALKKQTKDRKIPEVVGSYSVRAANDLKASLLIILTETGNTARLVCKYRPRVPVLCVTHSDVVASVLSLSRGAIPMVTPTNKKTTSVELIHKAMDHAKAIGLCKAGDTLVVVQGVVQGVSGQSNTFQIEKCI